MRYHLRGGTLITPEGCERKDMLVSDGRIEGFADADSQTPAGYERVDCRGYYVSAGFVDIHQHGGGGADYMDGAEDTYLRATEAHLAHGTTSVMPTLLSATEDDIILAVENYLRAKNDSRIRANLLGIHIEGPYISPYQAGAQKPEHIRVFDEAEYGRIAKAAQGNIKRWSVAPEVAGAKEFADFAKKEGIALSIAHSNAETTEVRKAFDWGYRHVTHLYSCTSTIIRKQGFRHCGVLEAAYLLDGMNVEIIADGCHLPPDLLTFVAKFKKNENIALISDAMRAAGENVSESFLGSASDPLPVIIEDGVAKLCDRSAFGGSIATADRLIRSMVSVGVSIPDAVKMMTVNPLRMMGLDLKKGELKAGFDADVCVFDGDINIKTVICGGRLVI